MDYYYDRHGWLTAQPQADRITTIAPPAESALIKANFTGVSWVLVPYAPPAEIAVADAPWTKITRGAFQNRFPKLADGVSTKYDGITLLLGDDGYAASLGVTGAAMYSLRLLITKGLNSMAMSSHVDFAVTGAASAASFTGLLMQYYIPTALRLSAAERTAILAAPITDAEKFTG